MGTEILALVINFGVQEWYGCKEEMGLVEETADEKLIATNPVNLMDAESESANHYSIKCSHLDYCLCRGC